MGLELHHRILYVGFLGLNCLFFNCDILQTSDKASQGGVSSETQYWDLFKSDYCKDVGAEKCEEEAQAYHRQCAPNDPETGTDSTEIELDGRKIRAYKSANGEFVAEGDMIISEEYLNQNSKNQLKMSATNRSVIGWNTGVVHYYFKEDVPETPHRAEVRAAMKVWEDATLGSYRFVEVEKRDPAQRTLEFAVDASLTNSCNSTVGMVAKPQINLHPERCGVGTVVHEIGHTLGLMHEHMRPDRDSYVMVLWCNIIPSSRSQFYQMSNSAGLKLTPYDYNSIMHYGRSDFSIDPGVTTLLSRLADKPVPLYGGLTPTPWDIYGVGCILARSRGATCGPWPQPQPVSLSPTFPSGTFPLPTPITTPPNFPGQLPLQPLPLPPPVAVPTEEQR